MLQGSKNQLYECFEDGEKWLMLGEEEGDKGRTKRLSGQKGRLGKFFAQMRNGIVQEYRPYKKKNYHFSSHTVEDLKIVIGWIGKWEECSNKVLMEFCN